MAEPAVATVATPALTPPAETPATTSANQAPQQVVSPTKFIDFDELEKEHPGITAKIKPRWDRIYSHTKDNERKIGLLSEHNLAMERRLEEVLSKVDRRELTEAHREVVGEISSLEAGYQKALEAGDYTGAAKFNTRLLSAMTREQKFGAAPAPKANGNGAELPPGVESYIDRWSEEIGDDGNFLRPWAHKGHPRQTAAATELGGLMSNPEWVGRGIPTILQEVERRMRPASRPSAAPVLGGSTVSAPRADSKVGLLETEKAVAEKIFPKLAARDAHARYLKQKRLLGKDG